LWKNKGFTLVEVIIAASILFSFVSLITPILSHIFKEQLLLRNQLENIHLLHDELLLVIREEVDFPLTFSKSKNGNDLHFTFTKENSFIKGCVSWDVFEDEEVLCLYGIYEES